jgi:uncharacterized protein (DUF934 family)
MALLKNGKPADDPFVDVSTAEELPAGDAVLVSLAQWQAHRDELSKRTAVAVKLASDEHPRLIANDLDKLAMVALEFPVFGDGRAYSYARLLRDRYGYTGELRAVGDVLLEQLHFMHRVGFDAFQVTDADAVSAWETALADLSVWYQPTGDGRASVIELRHPNT